MDYFGPNPFKLVTISVAKMPDLGLFGASKWLVFPFSGPFGATNGAPKG